MNWISRTTAVATLVAVVIHGSLSPLAATGATIDGTVEVPCDPSRVSEVALVIVQPVSGGSPLTVDVDPSTGEFHSSEWKEGEYDLVAIGADGQPLTPDPTRVVLQNGRNAVVLSLQPPGCEKTAEGEQQPGEKGGLKAWQLSLIYVGVVGAVILALYNDDEEQASPF